MGFLDRVKTSVTGVTEQQKYAQSIRKISAKIQASEKEITNLTNQVGAKCVAQHLGETDTEYEELFAAIRQNQKTIQELGQEIERLKAQQEEEEAARQQALQEREQAEREARQKAMEEREAARQKAMEQREAARQKAQEEKERQEAAQREEQQRALDQLNATSKVCTECGKRNELNSKFCIYCGHPYPAPEPLSFEAAAPAGSAASEPAPGTERE